VSDPPACGAADDDEEGADEELDDPQPASARAAAVARMAGADRINLRLWFVLGLTATLLL
jgi:hypothetical protein